jgi:O-antigen/teichoic acid export membrane protein
MISRESRFEDYFSIVSIASLRMIAKLRHSQFAANVSVLAGGTALAQAMALVVSPILTRLYTPEDFGMFGLFTVFLGFSGVLVSLRLEAAIPTPTDDSEAALLTFLSILLAVPLSIVAGILFFVLIRWEILGFGALPLSAVPLAFLGILSVGVFSALRYWCIRVEEFRSLSHTTIWQNVARTIGTIGFGFLGMKWLGLVIGDLAGRLTGLIRMSKQSWPAISRNIHGLGWAAYRDVFFRYKDFPRFVLPSSLIDAVAVSLPLPILAYSYGPEVAGYFALTQRIISLPSGMIGKSVADVFHSRMGECARGGSVNALEQFKRVSKYLLFIGLGPSLLIMALAPFLFSLFFGSSWLGAGRIAAVMAPWALAQFVVSPVSRAVFVFGGQMQKLIYDCTAAISTVLSLCGAWMMGLSCTSAIALLSATQFCAYGLYFVLLHRIVRNSTKADLCADL